MVFANIDDNGICGCVFALDVANLEEEGDILGNLSVFSKDVCDRFQVGEVVVDVFCEAGAQVLSPSMLGGFSREECPFGGANVGIC